MFKRFLFIVAVTGLFVAYFYNPFRSLGKSPIVQTSSGQVIGSVSSSRTGKEFYEYLGIPYAQPPVGEKRFEVKKYLLKFTERWIHLFVLKNSHQNLPRHGQVSEKPLRSGRYVCNWKCWQTNWLAARIVCFSTYSYRRYKVQWTNNFVFLNRLLSLAAT